ncbi:MAG: hypothetical protein HKM88_01780 [Halobacteria archaeon]|nr:hypothetical protein [Halobacteria archaeon]
MSIPAANGGRSIRGLARPVLSLAMWMWNADGAGAAEVQQHRDAGSGLLSWPVEESGLSPRDFNHPEVEQIIRELLR